MTFIIPCASNAHKKFVPSKITSNANCSLNECQQRADYLLTFSFQNMRSQESDSFLSDIIVTGALLKYQLIYITV